MPGEHKVSHKSCVVPASPVLMPDIVQFIANYTELSMDRRGMNISSKLCTDFKVYLQEVSAPCRSKHRDNML